MYLGFSHFTGFDGSLAITQPDSLTDTVFLIYLIFILSGM